IYKLPYFPDRIVHHCIMNVVEPIWEKTLIRDTYSSLKGRGVHDGVKRVKSFLKDKVGTQYCLKLDIKKFYPSIDHDILKRIIRKKVKCNNTLSLLDEIIDSAPGVPIGNYLSQYFGNLYLGELDHWCKEILRIRYYARYCDDIVVFSDNKQHLHEVYKQIELYCRETLNLNIKGNWQVFPTRVRGVDFLGYRFFGDYTLIRKRIVIEFKKKMKTGDVNKSSVSYYGWLKHGNGHRLWMKYGSILK
ncbi:MAG: RNA-directed DNA polymerase, partial [Desulfamplus sp.]|nr:RNA-directed DNA polymerase [Desulfamplus sp.]